MASAQLAIALWLSVAPAAAIDWQFYNVDASAAAKFSSMKADKDGNLHVAYVLEDNDYTLRYAFWDQRVQRWFAMTVATRASFCSLALDSKQQPHIAWADQGTGYGSKLRHAVWNGTTWTRTAIPLNSEIIGYYTSIAIDAEDHPNISFYEYRGPAGTDIAVRLRHVAWNGKNWEVRTVDPSGGSGKFNAIAIDKSGRMHITYANVGEGSSRYAYSDGQAWTRETFDNQQLNNGDYVGHSMNLVVDSEGNPHATYMNVSTHKLKYAVRRNGRWQIEVVDALMGTGYPDRNSIVLDQEGNPYITYYDSGRGALKIAFRQGSRWVAGVVDASFSGFTSSVQISNGQLWITYSDPAGGSLKAARTDLQALREVSTTSAADPGARAQLTR